MKTIRVTRGRVHADKNKNENKQTNKQTKKDSTSSTCIEPCITKNDIIEETKFQKTTIFQVYAPTNNADEDEKEDFYFSLQTSVNAVPKCDILLITGDSKAKDWTRM
jgi:exonuclease III